MGIGESNQGSPTNQNFLEQKLCLMRRAINTRKLYVWGVYSRDVFSTNCWLQNMKFQFSCSGVVYCLKRPSMIFPCAPRISLPDPFSPLLHFSISFTFQWHSPSTLFSFYVCTYFSGLEGRPYMGGYISAQLWYCRRCLFISANPHFWRVVSFYKDLTFSRFCYPSISTCGLCLATFSSRARVAGNESW